MDEVFSEETVNRIIIGLGGQGSRIVNMVANYLDSHGGIPKNEAFIFIDSNDADLSGWCRNIQTSQPTIYKKPLPMPSGSIFSSRNPWFPEKYIALVGGIGAGQRRVFGKALYTIHRDGIRETINKTLQDLVAKTNKRDFVVILVSSLGGGTGSSIMVDLSMDIRNWIQTSYKDPIVMGFGILPSMDEEDITIGNAMAALKELHFVLSRKEKKEKYWNPFKLFVLVGRNVSGAKDDDALREIAVRFFVDLGFVPGKKKKTEDKWFDLNDLMTAAAPLTNKFSTIGYHLVEFPAAKILRLFETEDTIRDMNSRQVHFQADMTSIRDRITGLESQLENARISIDKLEDEVNAQEMSQGWSSGKGMTKLRGSLELAKQQLQDITYIKNKLNLEFRELESKTGNLMGELNNLKAFRDQIYKQVLTPSPSINMHQIPLTEEEINYFRGKEVMLDITRGELASTFKQVMEELGKFEEYDTHVHKPFTELQIATSPLLNYQHLMKKEQVNPNILKILLDKEFIEIDTETGGIIDEESKIGFVAAILSSHKANIDEGKLGKENAENILRRTIARHAQLFPLNVPLDRFSVNIYTLMIGLHPWAPAPGYPSRLSDLDIMRKMYRRFNEEELFLHHSLFLGDFQLFSEITGIPIPWGDTRASVSSVIQFWKNYDLVDREAKWSRVPITVVEILRKVEELDNQLSLVKPKLVLLDAPAQFSPTAVANIRSHVHNASADLVQLEKSLNDYMMRLDEGRDYLLEFISQVSEEDTVDDIHGAKIKSLLETTESRITVVQNRIQETGGLLGEEVPGRLQKINGFVNSISVEDQTPQVVHHIIDIGRNLEDISPRIPDLRKNLLQLEVPLGDIRAHVDTLTEKLTRTVGT